MDENARAREWHARALTAFSLGKIRTARASLLHAGAAFKAAGDRPNAALLDAMIAFVDAEHARATNAIGDAHVAASKAWAAAHRAGHEPFAKEVERFEALLDQPIATSSGDALDSAAVSELLKSPEHIVVDGHRARIFSRGKNVVDLGSRFLLVDMLSSLACATPISSRALAARVFRVRAPNPAHLSRLKSQLTLIRKLAKGRLGHFTFEDQSFCWRPKLPVIVLIPVAPILEARIESLLSRGKSHSVSQLAVHFGTNVSLVKKALIALEARGSIHRSRSAKRRKAAKPAEPSKNSERWTGRDALGGMERVQLF